MKTRDLQQIVSENLKYFMGRDDSLYHNPNSLSSATKDSTGKAAVTPNTIRNLLKPTKRPVTTSKPAGYPTLDKLEALAKKLPKCEAWMLLHPDIKRALRAMEMDSKIQAEYDTVKTQ
jgi:hypothetical protein